MTIDVRTITLDDLPYIKEGDEFIIGYHHYKALGSPVPFGVLGDVSVSAKRKNLAMPSGWELATVTPYEFDSRPVRTAEAG